MSLAYLVFVMITKILGSFGRASAPEPEQFFAETLPKG
jgi:hypothetical protein